MFSSCQHILKILNDYVQFYDKLCLTMVHDEFLYSKWLNI